jgi:hypothetical protein
VSPVKYEIVFYISEYDILYAVGFKSRSSFSNSSVGWV